MDELLKRFAGLSPAKRQLLSSALQPDGDFDIFPLSFAQERLWFLEQLVPGNPAYHMPLGIRLTGRLDLAALAQSIAAVVRRHEVLRTRFLALDGQPAQVIVAAAQPSWQLVDLQAVPHTEQAAAVRPLLTAAARQPFDLTQGPLLRYRLFRLAPADHVLLLTIHHIVFDGWSIGILLQELLQLYDDFSHQRPASLEPLALQYADFAVWQREWAETSTVLDEQLAYWRAQLAGAAVLELPTDYARPAIQTFPGAEQSFTLPEQVGAALKQLGRQELVTLFMTALAGFLVLLQRYTGQTDISVGSPVANRSQPETQALLGFFVNTLVLRTDLAGDPRFRTLVRRVRDMALAAYEHQDLPFEQLVEALHVERSLSHAPLCQVMFSVRNFPNVARQMQDVTFTPFEIELGTAKFDLSMTVDEYAQGLVASIEYNTDLFAADTITRMGGHFQTLLAAIAADPDQRIGELPLLTAAEREQLLVAWNATGVAFPTDRCIHQLFEEQAARTPDAVALVCPAAAWGAGRDVCLTYRELNERANRVARSLRRLGIGPEALVGLCLERSPELAIGLLGIFKSGGAFVPLDPEYPADRLAFMLADAQVAVLLTQQRLDERLPAHTAAAIYLDSDRALIARASAQNLSGGAEPAHLAYVIYTSGSTGRPKGVMVEHGTLVNTMFASQRCFALSADATLPCIASFSFDIALFELFGPLLAGGRAIMVTKQQALDLPRFATTLRQISFIHALPSMMRQIVDFVLAERARTSRNAYLRLKQCFVGGDLIPPDLVADMRTAFPNARIYLGYGPTEGTIMLTNYTVPAAPPAHKHIVGVPMSNMALWLYNAHQQLVPIGVPGEIAIGGAGLVRGYLNRPDLTAERFVPNPFATTNDERRTTNDEDSDRAFVRRPASCVRLYKTGDLARWLPDGNLEFVRRIDQQVKVRGFRIELGEIEAVLRRHPAVRDGAVVARAEASGEQRLVAYVVSQTDEGRRTKDESAPASSVLPPSSFVQELRDRLAQHLPDYMVPSAFVFLAALPLTPNGKLDRKALPEPQPQPQPQTAQGGYVPPATALERTITAIWQAVLQVEQVGVHDSFFDLGGHSLLMVRVHSMLRDELRRDLTIVDLFQYPTIHALAQHLSPATAVAPPAVSPSPAPAHQGDAIAIIGMTGRFPGAPSLDAFGQNLREGVESISFFSAEELIAAGFAAELVERPDYVRAKGVLDRVAWFDAAFFGFTPREAAWMDPQHRIFLECTWEALENAGYDSETYAGRIGVFAGVSPNTYLLANLYSPELFAQGGLQTLIGNHGDSLTTRVSYKLNLLGLSVNVQTACSTSLVAVSLGCESLLNGQCDMVLAGGVSISVPVQAGYVYEAGGIASPDGHCRAFDAQARGTVGGDGVGVVVLKRLADALRDGDSIRAVIKGWALNNDGALKVGYTAPGVDGQRQVIAAALARAGVAPDTIGYVEAHGTGTPLGDPIEVAALTQAFRASTQRSGFCALGSVKTNIGHLDAAAGVAGLLKTVLALQTKQLPPSLHYAAPNPQIDFANSPFYVNAALAEWPASGTPRRAGVSSFGIGGTNAHVVLEEAPAPAPSGDARAWQLLVLSAKTASALDAQLAQLASYLQQHHDANLADVAYTLQVGRRGFEQRLALVCRDRAEALALLESLPPDRTWSGVIGRERAVVFMFPGQGAQFAGMGWELYQAEPVFRAAFDRCCELFRPHLGRDLREMLYSRDEGRTTKDESEPSSFVPRPSSDAASLDQTQYTQPALFAVEYALAQLWMSWGVRPQAMLGHSLGEYVAACLAGVFDLEDAVALVAARGRLMQSLPAGAMLAVPMGEAELRPLLGPGLSLAAINAPELCVISGPVETVAAFHEQLVARGSQGWRLATSHAFHSAMLEPIMETFAAQVARVALRPPQIPFVSNVTGDWITPDEATDPAYWVRHLRQPVQFARGLQTMQEEPDRLLLEVGPGRTLRRFAQAQGDAQNVFTSLQSAAEPASEQAFMLAALGQLWVAGALLDWQHLHTNERRRRLPLPSYPFERQRYWVEPHQPPGALDDAPTLSGKRPNLADWLYLPTWRQSLPPAPVAQAALAEQHEGWIVFADASVFSAQLVARLEQAGQAVIVVRAGERFAQLSERAYQLNPDCPQDYVALLHGLRAQPVPQKIAHLWSLTPQHARSDDAFFVQCQRTGYYSLLYLAQALEQAQMTQPIQIEVVTNDAAGVTGGEAVRPAKTLLLGPCKVIPQEYLNVSLHCLDVVVPLAKRRMAALIDQLLAEFQSSSTDRLIAYRGAQRWVQSFEPLVQADAASGQARRLRPGGVYMITGGFGNVGLQLAEYLARSYQARLVLLGRSPFPARAEWAGWLARHDESDGVSERIRRVQACEALGAEVLVVVADVADEAQLRATLKQTLARFGTLNGVLHTAAARRGPESLQPITTITRAASEAQFQAKVRGTAVLAKVLRGRQLDFCMLFSSNAAILGGLGFAAYAAANLYLDAFAAEAQRNGAGYWLSVNWDGWPADAAAMPAMPMHTSLEHYTMTRAEAVAALERALALPASQVIIATGDLPARLAVWIRREPLGRAAGATQAGQAAPVHPRPDVGAYVAPRDEIERKLAAIWEDLLGIERAGVEDNFFALGGHSLLALQLISQVRTAFQIELAIATFFEVPTIAGLAQSVSARRADATPPTEAAPRAITRRNRSIDQQLADLAALSPEETASLLQTEAQRIK
jgi:amino acid adenylation domain-containing protein